jgi:hypothetical protein
VSRALLLEYPWIYGMIESSNVPFQYQNLSLQQKTIKKSISKQRTIC